MKTEIITQDNEVSVLKLQGRLAGEEVKKFQKTLQGQLKVSNRLVIDCTELEYLDSSGLGALISGLKSAISHGGDVRLSAVPGKVKMMLEITRADKIFKVHQTADDAVKSYQMSTTNNEDV